ncbi:MAG: SpoIIE family protein phosphatase [Actinobacteria bacterium]|nr:SpoIIE family protein phosphatase [Actinomycetota bacterium]
MSDGDEHAVIDWGVATLPLAGQKVSGDLHLVVPFPGGVLVAVADGLGHGEEAAAAAQSAVTTLKCHAREPVISLVKRTHLALHATRGVAMTIASFNSQDDTMTWLGVGNVEGTLLAADDGHSPKREVVSLRGGVVGYQLPPLRVSCITVRPGDLLFLATDGIRSTFSQGLPLISPPQQIADHIMSHHNKGDDDALVLVARYLGDPR